MDTDGFKEIPAKSVNTILDFKGVFGCNKQVVYPARGKQ